jgi:hypothetical protein
MAGGPRRPEAPDTPLRRSVPRGTAPRPADGTAGRHDTDPAGHAPERGADDWRLDEHTRDVGRRGLAAARAILDRGVRAA